MIVCFIGHRKIQYSNYLKENIYNTVKELIVKGANCFLFGSRSEFNDICLDIVTEMQKTYSHIKRIYVRSQYLHISKLYENYLLQSYDETYFPVKLKSAGKYAYVERNQEMIDKSDCCIFYYNKDCNLALKDEVSGKKTTGGTFLAFRYALIKKKHIINLYNS